MPSFPPIHVSGRGGRRLFRRALWRRRKALAVGLAVTAAALAASTAHSAAPRPVPAVPRGPAAGPVRHLPPQTSVRAPVRIADAAVAGLLHPGDRVDVLAGVRVVAAGVTVVAVPAVAQAPPDTAAVSDAGAPGGALIVLTVPRRIAAALSGAAATSPLAVALC
ncbi:hypothetical protein [Streptomyces sp. NBC_01190]|uniref:hypothetical protein n=1 Tax=Streptomyces sp. NBC_01190 TaxID=2903767 RepID=UPI003868C448|nr:hypothetical protein OG519_12495 [Streptomyces sp. NBC_01190]